MNNNSTVNEMKTDSFPSSRSEARVMTRLRRVLVLLPILAPLACMMPGAAVAADWPTKPIRLIVPYQAGGGTDIVARVLAPKLGAALKQSVVVENKPGAGGMIGVDAVAKATPDGHTILIDAPGIVMNPSLYKKVPYDVNRDFQPVAQLISLPFVVVANPKVPAANIGDLVQLAKKNAKGVNVATAGPSTQLVGELFKLTTESNMMFIPYKGSAPASLSVLSGETDVMFSDAPSVSQHISSGRLKALAVTGNKRVTLMPDVPTAREGGLPTFNVSSWYGIFAPTGTPPDVVARLNEEINRALASPEVIAKINQMGAEPTPGTPDAFGQFFRSEVTRWKDVIVRAKIPPMD
jgi:tripartite-type tricarboxylate transporter receptor subunit TctC